MKRIVLALALIALASVPLKAGTGSNMILAAVGDDVITVQDVELDRKNWQEEDAARKQFHGPALSARISEIRHKTFDRLVECRLIVQEFHREGLFFSDAQADDLVAAEIKKDYGGDQDKFHAALAYYGETEDEFRAAIVEVAIISYMTYQNVDKKLSSTSTRDAQVKAWLDSLRSKAYVKYFSPPEK